MSLPNILITLFLTALPLLCIIALIIMHIKRLQKDDDGKKAKFRRAINNTITSVLILNYTLDIILGLEYLLLGLDLISTPFALNISVLIILYLLFEVTLTVSVLILLCNLIRVIVKKTNESWKRILLYILICSIAVFSNCLILRVLIPW